MDVTPVAEEAIPSFKEDLFPERRNATNSAGVPYDPEATITQGEIDAGLSYADKRVWLTREDYREAVAGNRDTEWITKNAPRIKGLQKIQFFEDYLPEGVTVTSVDQLANGTVDLRYLMGMAI